MTAEAFSDDGALHTEWPRLVLYLEDHPETDLADAAQFVAAVRALEGRRAR